MHMWQRLMLLKWVFYILHLFNDYGFFDISRCLFLPSLATVKGVSADSIATGGIGGGEKCCLFYYRWGFLFKCNQVLSNMTKSEMKFSFDGWRIDTVLASYQKHVNRTGIPMIAPVVCFSDCRGFPPSAGLSFSCWFLISRFSSACDSHPVRLLTVVRHMSRAEQHFSCLSVSISSSGCLVISTEEEAYQSLGDNLVSYNCCKKWMTYDQVVSVLSFKPNIQ